LSHQQADCGRTLLLLLLSFLH
jgi:hypothetical protein